MPKKLKSDSKQSLSFAKGLVKTVLGQVPFTAELYWLVRHGDKKINSRFNLDNLEKHIEQICQEAEEIRAKLELQNPANIFIFASLHYWIEHAALTSMTLAAQGHQVTLGYLPYHDWQEDINSFDLRRQNLYAQNVFKKAGSLIQAVSLLDLHSDYKIIPDDLLKKIEQVTRYDAMYTLQVENVDESSKIYRLRCKRNMRAARAALSWLKEHKPDIVVVPNGTIQEFGVIYEVARFLNIPTVTYEFGDQRQRIWLAQNSKVMQQETDAMWEAFKDKPLNNAEKHKVRELFEARRKASIWKNFSRLWQQIPAQGVESAREKLGLDDRKVVLLATNVLGDSLTLGRELFSQSMEEWLERTLQYFAGKPEVQLVIRVHPGEKLIHGQSMVDVIERVLPKLPEHIHVIRPEDKTNTYDLIAAADVGLVYTTTVGLEMAMSGIPVIVTGKTHYRERGFTHDPSSWVKYYQILKALLEDPKAFRLDKETMDKAWAYAYRFFFDFPRPYPWHLVKLWDDFNDHSLKDIYQSKEWQDYAMVFSILAGKPLDWQEIRG